MFVEVLPDPLELNKYVGFVEDNGSGAIATFMGVTRDNFDGKKVLSLSYEAYVPMAEKEMQVICRKAHDKWDLKKMAVAHRIGHVGVGEPSVIIAVSSAHRREALEACHWAIDELKATVPIWKKELYEGGEVWKENSESRNAQRSDQV
ncbi:Molybdopterin biosynthesis MoaE [Coccomyxa subellipsoidea C-169]|uniref:Molybdopterin synthase catalytic subunit n=1 Tax=Coccomyxa subellipsoidea (strain C-169) TaxID=574566 RepID=I0YMQ6_COCSC|nr:Molybdopterin biosynthesis MoaE [Coccomyxa subellipsoidea C-169]EIE19675.1 Molybdopterin biosynthesis MoaE [Coccomyxa subellipsoidea C-169]|eukprot:XP_005644219.1 Molybdopterin biosynthesis MoaE [Coccomyxa subellipsoidea C-169]